MEEKENDLIRFGVSMERKLLCRFDRWLTQAGYPNRSEAIRALVRDSLVEAAWFEDDLEMTGTITLVYDHHQRDLDSWLTQVQHQWEGTILATTHIHLDHHNCLEVLIIRGKPLDIRSLYGTVRGAKGVKHGQLALSTTGEGLP